MNRAILNALAAVISSAALFACVSGHKAPARAAVPVGDTVALTASGKLISFNRGKPGGLVGAVAVSGLAAGETLLGLDYRPANGLLYGLGSAGNVYTVDPATGVAWLKAWLKARTGDDHPFAALSGSDFGVDFDPAADRLRVVSNSGQNLRIDVDTGDTQADSNIRSANGVAAITAVAHAPAAADTAASQLFAIDAAAGMLHLQDPAGSGTLSAGRPLGVAGAAADGFDIDARGGTGYLAMGAPGASTLYAIDLASGQATSLGVVAGGEAIKGLALRPGARPR